MSYNSLGHLLNNVALVTTQYVDDYGFAMGGSAPYFKFKGGSHYIVHTNKDATAIGVVLHNLAAGNRSAGEYPVGVKFFASEDEAIASLDEWERSGVKTLTQTA